MPLSYSDPVAGCQSPVVRPCGQTTGATNATMHGNHRQILPPGLSGGSVVSCQSPVLGENGPRTTDACSRRSSDLNHLRHRIQNLIRSLRRTNSIRINAHNVSEPSLSDLGACARRRKPKQRLRHTRRTLPVRHQPDDGISCQLSVLSCQNADNATSNHQPNRTRPETHQNLIYPDKEQKSSPQRRPTGRDVFLLKNDTRHDLVTFPRETVYDPEPPIRRKKPF